MPQLSVINLIILSVGVSLGIFMNVLDTSIANVAVPSIAGAIAVSPDEGTWVITSFTVCSAIVMPLTGWLARRFGEVRLFVISTLAFTITSVLCGLSTNLTMLIVSRCLQGTVSGPMIPLSQSLLLRNYPEDKKGTATAIWSMTAVVAPISGPILGGWITDNYTWPWIFYINLPVGLLSAFIAWYYLRNHETPITKLPLDKVGLILIIMVVGCLQIALDKGNNEDWFRSNFIITLLIISFVGFCYFLAWELTEKNPIVDLSLFKLRNFTIGVLGISVGYLVFFANVVIFPLWLQTQMGYTPTWAGLAAAPIGILALVFSPFVGRYLQKFDLRFFVTIGFLVFAVTYFWQTGFNTDVSYEKLFWPRFFQGIGVAFFFVPLISLSLSGLPSNRIASASGLVNFLRIVGGSFGTSISITIWQHRATLHQSQIVEKLTYLDPNFVQWLKHLQQVLLPPGSQFEFLQQIVNQQAFMLATNDIFWISGWIFILLLFPVWLARPPFFVRTEEKKDDKQPSLDVG